MTTQAKQLALELERAAVNFAMSDPARELMVKVAKFLNGNRSKDHSSYAHPSQERAAPCKP